TPQIPFPPPPPEGLPPAAPLPALREAPARDDRFPSEAPARAAWLDAFRGLAVVGMILVNNPGDCRLQSRWLSHAAWDGLTFADLVFPFFLVSVGISLTFMLGKSGPGTTLGKRSARLLRRSLTLVVLGLLFHLWISRDFSNFRIPGVLQRIGICSLLGGFIILQFPPRGLAAITLGILGAYAALLLGLHPPTFLETSPGAGRAPHEVRFEDAAAGRRPGYLSKEGSLPSYVDRQILGRHLYRPEYDPEGILSTGSAVSTVLLGSLAGLWLRRSGSRRGRHRTLFLWGVALAAAGLAASGILPVNKALWSPSFVLVTAGISFAVLSGLAASLEAHPGFAGYRPLEIFGANALLVYVGSNFLTLILENLALGDRTLETRLFEGFYLRWSGGAWAAFFYGISNAAIWIPILWVLHRKRIHVRA
ncbi:MAG TPA: heparan-alpha-glucosaminide N-acetyltransferase domain-containing protein, partial [Planctomycetota bacterium]|nr:heparan-alpha-glucosaminide N-acetyltransferase domain-containing protein [Planctomycetota bacterium]